MKFAAGITLYNPTIEELNKISKYEKCFDKIILFDNSEPNYTKPIFTFSKKFTILSDGENKGLSIAYNLIIKYLNTYDFDYLCALDQDSDFIYNEIVKIKEYLENNSSIDIGIIGPYIDYGYKQHIFKNVIEKRKWVITSGSFINLKIVREEQLLFDENYFIDKFEIDFCQQMIENNHEVLMYHYSILQQKLGEFSGYSHPNHCPLRHYYLFRNRFYFNKKWFRKPKYLFLDVLQTIKHVFLILVCENDKFNKIKELPKAYMDYKKGMMGKRL